ncbi:MAG: chromate resistance protein [Gammaproteobacteria bacterium]|nr:chromate resistance protein [Gammaproteobacteria bacterium]MBU1654288.1 chromate resistance protein [Gammaproteobacteria bacterium]MBU1960629.1 chromate resistance protein [Gammaproteobacteria bacterium]
MNNWLLLILSLPTENATARMRAWRALKAAGAAVLRDGVYLLPTGEGRRERLAAIAEDVAGSGGTPYLLESQGGDFAVLFDRTADYHQLSGDIAQCRGDLDKAAAGDLARLARKLRKGFEAIRAIDFFPGPAQAQTGALLDDLEAAIRACLSPGEPTSGNAIIERRDPAAYRDRLWATRHRPWVDRLASAWLIRRFIDTDARFLWLENPADCPEEALGFDFDGAAFSHIGERVTFETLLASFGLETDPVLARIARIVHYLDVGGLPAPEAPGLEALLAGMRASIADDDPLLAAASGAFDFLYASFKENP